MNAIDDACSALQSRLAELSVLIHVLSVGKPTALSLSRRFPSLLALSCSLGISSVLKLFSFVGFVSKCCTPALTGAS